MNLRMEALGQGCQSSLPTRTGGGDKDLLGTNEGSKTNSSHLNSACVSYRTFVGLMRFLLTVRNPSL